MNSTVLSAKTHKNAKKKLELKEKKAEIQKLFVEIKKEKLLIEASIYNREIGIDLQKLNLYKINTLSVLLGDITVDSERTILGSEPFLIPTIGGQRREVLLDKIMELVVKL